MLQLTVNMVTEKFNYLLDLMLSGGYVNSFSDNVCVLVYVCPFVQLYSVVADSLLFRLRLIISMYSVAQNSCTFTSNNSLSV